MPGTDENKQGLPGKEVVLKDSLLMHNNMFWTSTLEFHLEGLLDQAYADEKKRELIRRWLDGSSSKDIIIKQYDFPSDPLLIRFGPEAWSAEVMDDGQLSQPDVELQSTHMGLVALGDSLRGFLYGFLSGDFKLPLLFKSVRNHIYAMRIFF
jgi:hypothetical protein